MDNKLIDFKLCVDHLGGFDMDSFPGRISVQKKIYLLQLSGLDLGYRFNWYIKGPYSPSLAETAFEVWNNKNLVDAETKEYELSDDCLRQLESIKKLVNSQSPCRDLEHYKWLELLASVHYLKHIAYIPKKGTISKQHISKVVTELKPYFNEDHVLKAWDELDSLGLIKNKTLE